jgi:hypothetical protein
MLAEGFIRLHERKTTTIFHWTKTYDDWFWLGEQIGKWLDASTYAALIAGDQALLERVHELIERLAESQEEDGYLVVWQEQTATQGYNIHGQRVGNDGALLGGKIDISTWSYDQLKPRLAFNGSANQFLVVWEDHHWGWGDDWDVYGQRVGTSGELIGGNFAISWEGANHHLNPDVTYKPTANEYLVAWEYEHDPDNRDVYVRRVGSDGALFEGEKRMTALSGYEGRPAVAADGGWSYLVVWEGDRDASTQAINLYGELVHLYRLLGRVFAGDVGDESTPLSGVAVGIYCSNNAGELGDPILSSVTDADGWYGLIVGISLCDYYTILQTDLPGYTSKGAATVGGVLVNDNQVQYAYPLEGKVLAGNKFWDRAEVYLPLVLRSSP